MDRTDGRLVIDVREHRGHGLVFIEGLQDVAEFTDLTLGCRCPAIHHRAVREVDEARVRRRLCRRLREQRAGWNHRVEQRETERDAEPLEYRATRQMLPGEKHVSCSLPLP